MAAIVPSVIGNLDALATDNYEYWSFRVKTYLLAKDLWDIVEDTNEPPKLEDGVAQFKAWRKNNAKALQAIIIFCGKDAEFFIRGKKKARDAWKTLAETFEIPENLEKNDEVGVCSNSIDGGADLEIAANEVEGVAACDDHKTFFDNVGDWRAVKDYLTQHPEAIRAKNMDGETALHDAVRRHDVVAVKELLPLMENKDLEIPDNYGNTALYYGIRYIDETVEEIEIVKCIVEKNKELLLCPVDPSNCNSDIPLSVALRSQKPKLARYLYSVTPIERLKRRDLAQLVSIGLQHKILDIPFHILRRHPKLVIAKDHSGESPLSALASTRVGLFTDASTLQIWNRWIYNLMDIPPTHGPSYFGEIYPEGGEEEKDEGKGSCFGRLVAKLRHLLGVDAVYQMKLLHKQAIEILDFICPVLNTDNLNCMQRRFVVRAIFQAIEQGNFPFIKQIMHHHHDHKTESWFSSITNEHDKTVFQFAVEHRQVKIFDLIRWYFSEEKRKEFVSRQDKLGNNMLHVVGKLSPLTRIGHIRGAALQMQNELQWFKKVERMANPNDLNCINSDGRTPREEFTVHHRNLVKEGEKSMKETATSSSALVAALIITIMFAAVVTVPGGVNGDTGAPIYLHTKAFRIFIIADVVSLCSSTTSVMIFLGILTSRFAEEDFLFYLPTKLIIGFLTLFLSIGAMMVAFSSAIFIMLPNKPSLVIPSIVLAGVPIASFLWMQFPFLLEELLLLMK